MEIVLHLVYIEVLNRYYHHIGDICLHLKYDSSRVIISDIIVGGGNYEYYIKYKVLLKDGQEKSCSGNDFTPIFLYRKHICNSQ